jgi:hypothetical protein
MTEAEKRQMCRGCRDDYYNQPGNSTDGKCWCLESAKVVQRIKVGIWQNPPYEKRLQTTLSCHNPKGMAWIKEDDCRVVGNQTRNRTKEV